jgi:tRNA G37 N-methylase TrmD
MRIDVLTLFPDMFREVLATSMPGRAASSGAAEYHLHDLRQWTKDRHRTVDDRPFGGGPGMVMMCEPLWDAVNAVEASETSPARRVLLTPQGEPLTRDESGRPLLDCPHFTRPRTWHDREVPDVLLSGDHGAIADWRREQSVERTRRRRPDLLDPTPRPLDVERSMSRQPDGGESARGEHSGDGPGDSES